MHLPGELTDRNGVEVRVRRAWPRRDGSLIVEGLEVDGSRVRAGRIDAEGRPSMVPFREDPALPGLSGDGPAGDLLVHRLKRRAVVRSDGQYRKFLAGRKASVIANSHRAAAAALAGSELAVPDVVASDDQSVTLTAVPGVSLHDLGRTVGTGDGPLPAGEGTPPLDRWVRAWELWAHTWPRFVGAAVSPGPSVDVRAHSAEDEVLTIERWIDFAVSFDALGVSEERLRRAAASVVRSLLAGGSPAGLAHRDLHDKQILVDLPACAVGLIDCDTLAVAEPALDLANLSAHLDFRVAQGLLPAGAAVLGKERIRKAAESLQVPDSRFDAYASATALRLACIYAFRPSYRAIARTWFSEVEASLSRRTSSVPTVS